MLGGVLTDPASNQYIDNINPATGEVYSFIPDSDKNDVEAAVKAAQKALPDWMNTPADLRGKIMERVADLINQNLAYFAESESMDNGKSIELARTVDIPRAVQNFRFFASAIRSFSSEAHIMENRAVNYTIRQPLGIVGCISPWNLPLYLFTWKISPAIAAGNCVIAKPSEVTPMTAFLLSQICIEAGMPPGVLNIVHGLGSKAGEAIVTHPDIKAISFTGGTATGKHIAATAAPMFKKLSLELGGKNPNIIFADCDFDKMMTTTIRSSFSNQGQICLCGSRIFVEKPIYERFKKEFVEKVRLIKVGDPASENTQLGAIVSKQHRDKIIDYIKLAKKEGGKILCGGQIPEINKRCEKGYFIEPTVIEGLAYSCRVNTEEIFGPVVSITPFDTEEEVIRMANATDYGLACTIWTESLTRAHRTAARIQAGIVWVNCWMLRDLRTPFGGMKNSGMGREGGFEAFRFFTEAKNVCINLEKS